MIDRKSFIKRRFGIDLETGQLPHMENQTLKAIIDSQAELIEKQEADIERYIAQIDDHQKTLNENVLLQSALYHTIERQTHIIIKHQSTIDSHEKTIARQRTPQWAIKHLWKIFIS